MSLVGHVCEEGHLGGLGGGVNIGRVEGLWGIVCCGLEILLRH